MTTGSQPTSSDRGGPGFGTRPAVVETDLRLPRTRGKVRDVYELGATAEAPGGRLAIVASDRLSAFDVVLPTAVPGKGVILTGLAAWWLRWVEARGICPTHLLSTDAADLPEEAFEGTRTTRDELAGRVTIGRRCAVEPVECVVRGYLEGSGWADYQRDCSVCGITLPAGLRQCEQLHEPIFTPATKAEQGAHDENIGFDAACRAVGGELMETLRAISMELYREAAAHALARGIILADTKFEFGLALGADGRASGGPPVLVDEAFTPDSSRFWPADGYEPGRAQTSFDKQFVREHLQRLVDAGAWEKQPPGPTLPEAVIEGTLERYREAARRLTGSG